MIVPIVKKEEGERVEEYKGVVLMTSYKIYVTVLADRLREEMERKESLSTSQTWFRKRIGTIFIH